MGYINDIRLNAFEGTTEYPSLTEYHTVPLSAPYWVRLNEIPAYEDVSSLVVTSRDGGTHYTEVAALPSSGEFMPDWYSEVSGSPGSWNNGTLLFNSSDAGKELRITYKGTGSLVQATANRYPTWITNFGTSNLGTVIISRNTTLSGSYNYENLIINSGVTVTVNTSVVIKCTNTFINNGTITATNNTVLPLNDNKAYGSGYNYPSYGTVASNADVPNRSYNYTRSSQTDNCGFSACYGYRSTQYMAKLLRYTSNVNYTTNYDTLLSLNNSNIVVLGLPGPQGACGGRISAKGGYGGKGGGSIVIQAKEFYNAGTIASDGIISTSAVGQTHSRYGYIIGNGGSGDGGSIFIITSQYYNKGSIHANGGPANQSVYPGLKDNCPGNARGEAWNSGEVPWVDNGWMGKAGRTGVVYTKII